MRAAYSAQPILLNVIITNHEAVTNILVSKEMISVSYRSQLTKCITSTVYNGNWRVAYKTR
jgi:hypothetical protein